MPDAKAGSRVRSLVPSLTVRALRVATPEAVGAVAVTVAVSVAVAMPFVPPRPVTVRVNVSSVSSTCAGIVTTGVALVALSNVTPLAVVVSAQR